ncbi:hypothetical protein SLW70_15765 [Flavobacterium sp. NG2]|uniref:hypothetical protein n=1 Tax=Flavobacterium sp. NG2 TaxID=3097547 RepID=UPI002A82C92E|nr:hypothetical protein [Flavobacterium sp. NG2]WPR71371.1 hypothetical protein SLW70_15765 [Flavobacterium sp. NG2]
MKNIVIIAMFLGLFFTSCEKESLTPDPEFSDVTWYSSTPLSVTAPITIPAGKALSIFDLSQGTLSHEWKIKEGSHFLKSGFKNVNTVPYPDLTPYIDATKGLVTTDATVFIYFPTAGDYTVTLRNTYKDKVTYKGTTPVDAVLVDGVWVFEQVFQVKVLATIVP